MIHSWRGMFSALSHNIVEENTFHLSLLDCKVDVPKQTPADATFCQWSLLSTGGVGASLWLRSRSSGGQNLEEALLSEENTEQSGCHRWRSLCNLRSKSEASSTGSEPTFWTKARTTSFFTS